jgi:hypothetical protein
MLKYCSQRTRKDITSLGRTYISIGKNFPRLTYASAEPKMATLPEQCCTIPPFKSDYQPIGERFKLGEEGLEVYTTGPKDAKTALVAIYGLSRFPAGKT